MKKTLLISFVMIVFISSCWSSDGSYSGGSQTSNSICQYKTYKCDGNSYYCGYSGDDLEWLLSETCKNGCDSSTGKCKSGSSDSGNSSSSENDTSSSSEDDTSSSSTPAEGDTRKARCTGLPLNAEWNTVSSVTQTYKCFYDGCDWEPSENGVYNKTPSEDECRFKCVEDYFWNGTECVLDPCAQEPCIHVEHATGECVISEDSGYACKCEETFNWNGSECLNQCEPNPCVGIENSTEVCVKEDDFTKYSCKCAEGYLWSGEECLDPCFPNPCRDVEHSTTICTAVDAKTYKCACEDTYAWNGSECLNPCEPNPCVGVENSTEICTKEDDFTLYKCGCNDTYAWNGSECLNPCEPNPCAGAENSTGICIKEDDFTEYSCECKDNYVWKNNVCVGATRTYNCSGLPENAQWNSVSSYSQTWNGTGWFPPDTSATYNEAAGTTECRFKCSEGLVWNGTECTFPECGPGCSFPCKDSKSGITWSERFFGASSKPVNKALSYCDNLTEGGYSDWRLPNIDALRTLIQNCPNTSSGGKCNVSSSCLSSGGGAGCQSDCYNYCNNCGAANQSISKLNDVFTLWSSSNDSCNSQYYWVVDFSEGSVINKFAGYSDGSNSVIQFYVRCVR